LPMQYFNLRRDLVATLLKGLKRALRRRLH
jgi:hypothetical protein